MKDPRAALAPPARLALLLLTVGACHPSDRCDPGFHVEAAACVADDDASGDADGAGDDAGMGDVDASAPMNGDGDGDAHAACEPGEGDQSTFGSSCSSDADCSCPAPVCMPAPLGYCSQVQCADDPDVCPDGFTCFEVPESLQEMGVTHLCLAMGG
jgi:hypothetical protein